MRLLLGIVGVGSFLLVACGGAGDGGLKLGSDTAPPPASGGGDPAAPASSSGAAPASACAGVADAKSLSTDKSVADLHLLPSAVVYRDGTSILRVERASSARTVLYTSPDLVHSFADADVLVTVESPDSPDAILKIMPAGPSSGMDPAKGDGAITVTPTTPWNAGGTYVFGSDATSLYVLADVTDQGDTLYKLDKQDPNSMTVLAQLDAPLTDPQVVGSDVWFVRDGKRVYKVAQTVTDPSTDPNGAGSSADPPLEVFAIGYADCKLAVSGSHTFCSTGKAVEERDLTGANLVTLFDAMKQSTPSSLGDAAVQGDAVLVRSLPAGTSDAQKNGIRAITTSAAPSEKLLACGRGTISAFAADANVVVWSEDGLGVFTAPR